jgi:hypothetical protein
MAFDKVPYKRLMLKWRALGTVDRIYSCIEDWLKDSKQKVILLGADSDWIRVNSGERQEVRVQS